MNIDQTGPLSWEQLEKDEGIHLIFKDNQNEIGPILTQLINMGAAAEYDVGGLQGGAERELADAGKILPWDLSKLKNWPLVQSFLGQIPTYTSRGGKQYGIPIAANADSMIYLPSRTGGVIDSYEALFDPKFKGKTAMEDSWINSVFFAAIYLKTTQFPKIKNPADLDTDELDVVMKFLTEKKRSGQFLRFWNGWEDGLGMIRREEVWVMTGWEPIVYAAQKAGVDARYADAREGFEYWSNDLVLQVGGQAHYDAAHRFADWLLGGYYGCVLALTRGLFVPSGNQVEYARASGKFSPAQISQIQEVADKVNRKFARAGNQRIAYWQNVRPRQHLRYSQLWDELRNTPSG